MWECMLPMLSEVMVVVCVCVCVCVCVNVSQDIAPFDRALKIPCMQNIIDLFALTHTQLGMVVVGKVQM